MVSTKDLNIKSLWQIMAVFVVGLNLLFINVGGRYGDFALKSVTDIASRDLYLDGRLPVHRAIEVVNLLNLGRTPVAVFAEPTTAGISGDALIPSWYNFVFNSEISRVHSEQELIGVLRKRGVSYIILDSNWNGEDVEKKSLVEKVSEKIAEYGPISVRKIKASYNFNTELLTNPDFISLQGWSLSPGAIYESDSSIIRVNVRSPVVQSVSISAGELYKNLVVARCYKESTQGRIQINWLDVKGQFISTNIKTFDCSLTWSKHAMEVTAPLSSVTAVVYVSGHSEIPLEFKRSSLKK